MARHPVQISALAGLAAAACLLFLTVGTLAAVLWRADGWGGLGPADWSALRFTLLQALLSAGISVGLAIPLARALARRRFRGRGLVVTLLGAPFLLPVIVAVMGLLAVFGRSGLLSQLLGWAGLPAVNIYGLHGVVLAHVFFNLPLATRLILQGWLAIPAERFRLAASLDLGPAEVARLLERPMLRAVLPGAFMVIFLICLTSFAVALTMGGGPRATTIELAIYQAFRFEFDLGHAALLASVQFGLGALAAVAARWVSVPAALGGGFDRVVQRWDAQGAWLRLQDAGAIMLAALFLLVPLALVVAEGVPAVIGLPGSVWQAAGRSLTVALGSAALMLVLALPLAFVQVRLRGAAGLLAEVAGALPVVASPLVIGTGLFILLFPITDPAALALPVTALVNAGLSLPFALRALQPAVRQVDADYGRLAESLGMSAWARLRLIYLPRLRRPIGFALGLSAALSMGDLGVVTLFADPDHATLPLQMFRLMSAYRMADAAGAGVVLLALTFALFWMFDKGGRVHAAA